MKKRLLTPVVLGVGWILSLGLFYLLGLLTVFAMHRDPGRTGGEATLSEQEVALIVAQRAGVHLAPEEWKQSRVAPAGLITALAHTEGVGGSRAAYEAEKLAAVLSVGQVAQAVDALTGDGVLGADHPALPALMRQWGYLDGRSALAYLSKLPEPARLPARLAVLEGWFSRDPAAVFPGASPLTQIPVEERARAALRAYAKAEAAKALPLWKTWEPTPAVRQSAIRGAVTDLLGEGHRQAAVDLLSALAPGDTAEASLDLARHLLERDPDRAFTLLTRFEPDEPRLAVALVRAWALTEPQGAIQRAMALPPGEPRAAAIYEAARGWLAIGGMSALHEWLKTQEADPDLDPVAHDLAVLLADANPDEALRLALTVQQPALRLDAVAQVGSVWLTADPASARAALEAVIGEPATTEIFGLPPATPSSEPPPVYAAPGRSRPPTQPAPDAAESPEEQAPTEE